MNEEYINQILNFINQYFFITLISAAILLIINAFFGYKIFKFAITVESAVGLGIIAYTFIGPWIFQNPPEKVNLSAILGILFAALGALLAGFFIKTMLFVNGAGLGFFLGSGGAYLLSANNEFFAQNWVIICVGVLAALILGVLFIFFFKPIYILVSSVLGMSLVGFIISYIVCPDIYVIFSVIMVAIGFIAGIVAAVYQFKKNSKYYFY